MGETILIRPDQAASGEMLARHQQQVVSSDAILEVMVAGAVRRLGEQRRAARAQAIKLRL